MRAFQFLCNSPIWWKWGLSSACYYVTADPDTSASSNFKVPRQAINACLAVRLSQRY